MKTIEISTASEPLSAYAEEFSNEIVVLTLHGKAIAIVSSLKDSQIESLSLSMNPEFMEIIQRAIEEFKAGKKLSFNDRKKSIFSNCDSLIS